MRRIIRVPGLMFTDCATGHFRSRNAVTSELRKNIKRRLVTEPQAVVPRHASDRYLRSINEGLRREVGPQ